MDSKAEPSFAVQTLRGTFWIYASNYSGKLLVFLTTIILARLLTKDDYGVVGYALIVISFLDVLSDLGIGPALIYHREDPRAASTAFWLGLVISLLLFGITFLVAPLVGIYFRDPRAVPVIRVLALTYPISALCNVHDNLLRKNLAFKDKFIPDLARALSKGFISILFALLGFGAWSLIFGQLGAGLASVFVYWKVVPWRPAWLIDWKIARSLLNYGLMIVALGILAQALANLDYLVVGRYLGAALLGVYTMAFRFPELLISNFCDSIATVLFPLYVKIKDKGQSLGYAFITTLRYVSMVTIPLGTGLALIADPFVHVFLTDKWQEAVPVIRVICIYSVLLSLPYNTGSVYKAQNRTDIMTRLALVRLVVAAPVLYWAAAVSGSILSVAWAQAGIALFAGSLNMAFAARITGTSWRSIVNAIRPGALGSLCMAAIVYLVLSATGGLRPVFQLILAVLAGVSIYIPVLLLQDQSLLATVRRTVQTAFGRS